MRDTPWRPATSLLTRMRSSTITLWRPGTRSRQERHAPAHQWGLMIGLDERGARSMSGACAMERSGGMWRPRRWICSQLGIRPIHIVGLWKLWWISGRSFIGVSGMSSKRFWGSSRRRQAERLWPWRRSSSMPFFPDLKDERGLTYRQPSTWRDQEVGSRRRSYRGLRGSRIAFFGTWRGKEAQERTERSHKQAALRNGVEDPPRRSQRWGAYGGRSSVRGGCQSKGESALGQASWGHLCHIGCSMSGCQRSHEGLRGSFENPDPCVRMQFLKRGGLKRMKIETRESANQKIKDLRAYMAKDRAEKTQDGKRRGDRAGADNTKESGEGGQEDSTKAGGHDKRKVRFWEAPEEFKVDYTKGEDLKSFVHGPDPDWGKDRYEPQRTHPGRGGETAPEEARRLVQEAQRLADGPVLSALESASDNLYAWASARVARDPGVTLDGLLQEMALYGVGELAKEAGDLLEATSGTKAGEKARMLVRDTIWVEGEPGQGSVELEGQVWRNWDYGEVVRSPRRRILTRTRLGPGREVEESQTRRQVRGMTHWRTIGKFGLHRAVIRHHVQKRRHLFVPQHEPGSPIVVEQLRHERRTQFWSARSSMVVIDDDWKEEGAVNPGYGLWVGTTAFTVRGRELAWGPGGGYGRRGNPSSGPSRSTGRKPDEDEDRSGPALVARGIVHGHGEGGGRAGGSGGPGGVQAPSVEAKLCAGYYSDAVTKIRWRK